MHEIFAHNGRNYWHIGPSAVPDIFLAGFCAVYKHGYRCTITVSKNFMCSALWASNLQPLQLFVTKTYQSCGHNFYGCQVLFLVSFRKGLNICTSTATNVLNATNGYPENTTKHLISVHAFPLLLTRLRSRAAHAQRLTSYVY